MVNDHAEIALLDAIFYVESLLWDIKDTKRKKWGWSLIPEVLQAPYIDLWGAPAFRK